MQLTPDLSFHNIIDANYGIIVVLVPLILKIINSIYLIVVGILIKDRCIDYFPIAIPFINKMRHIS